MATTDDVDCLSTLCQALREVLADPSGLTSESEEQVRELFALLPQVFATDPHAGRTSQLLHACHPLHVVTQYLSTRWLCPPSVRICSMRCLMEVATSGAVIADHTGKLKGLVGEQLRDATAAACLINIVLTTHSTPEASTAAEVLFVLSMTVPSFRDDVRRVEGGVASLCARALQRPNAPQVQSYLAGVIRLLAEHYADILSSDGVQFVPMVFSALAAFDPADPSKPNPNVNSFGCCTSRRAAVLFLESLTEVLQAFPSSYIAALGRRDADHYNFMDPVRSVVDVLGIFILNNTPKAFSPQRGSGAPRGPAVHHQPSEATAEDCTEAAWALFRLIIGIEGRRGRGPQGGTVVHPVVLPALSEVPLWKDTALQCVAVPSCRPKLCLLREALCGAMTTEVLRPLITACLEALPVLCSLLVPERSNALCMREAAVILGVLLVKSPAARRELRRLVQGYESWAESLCARIQQLLRSVMVFSAAEQHDHQQNAPSCFPAEAFEPRRLLLVDVFQTILNDGDQAQHVDMLREERVAQALLHEQRRRYINSAAPSPLDTTFIEHFVATTGGGAALTARAQELCCRLALALMIEATNLTLTDEGRVEDDAECSMNTSGHLSNPALNSSARRVEATPAGQRRAVSPTLSRSGGTPTSTTGYRAAPRGSASRYQEWVDQHLGRPKPRTLGSVFGTIESRSPFRPSGTPSAKSATPITGALVSGGGGTSPSGSRTALLKDKMNGKSILQVVKEAPLASDEYLSMAIMMHLPIRYGTHYNRGAKAAVRKVSSPQGTFLQPIRRNNAQTWSAADVQVGELHVIFIPFHKLSCQVIQDEVVAVDKHLVELSKRLVTTPNVQRTRRWFLQDMVHDVLPKTELLLRDLLDLLYKFGVDDVVYQLSLVRVADEGRRHASGSFATAVDIADTAMPNEILRLSTGAFRDILHSGNILFAVQELRAHYFESQSVPVAGTGASGRPPALSGGVSGLQWNSLTEVDREIRELEEKLSRDAAAQQQSANMPSPQHYVDPLTDDAASNEIMARYQQGMIISNDASPPPSWSAAAEVSAMYDKAAIDGVE